MKGQNKCFNGTDKANSSFTITWRVHDFANIIISVKKIYDC